MVQIHHLANHIILKALQRVLCSQLGEFLPCPKSLLLAALVHFLIYSVPVPLCYQEVLLVDPPLIEHNTQHPLIPSLVEISAPLFFYLHLLFVLNSTHI